jgi:thiamine kinase-like enzyme
MLAAAPELGDDWLVRCAYETAASWIGQGALDSEGVADDDVVLGQGDCNLANFLWDGAQVRVLDFEDSGPSDRAFELALLVEHISAWSGAGLNADLFLALFRLTASGQARLSEFRRLTALYWLLLLLPDGQASGRNPPGALELQASRLLGLLG